MNIIEKIKSLWALNKFVQDTIKGGHMGIKPGYKTTEFWLTVLGTNLPTLIGTIQGVIPPKWAAIILAAANGLYGILRAVTKQAAPPTS